MDGDISTTKADDKEQIEVSNKKFLYARAVHSNHMVQHHMQQILEHQRVVNEYRSMADEETELILLESNIYKTDPAINQYIMQMINTDISWYEKTFGAILMELQKIQNGKTIMQTSEESSEKEMINHCDESHVTLSNLSLYRGEKAQKDHDNIMSESVSSKVQKNWHRKSFQINKNEGVELAMMCWESLEDSEQKGKDKKNDWSRLRNKQ